MTSNNWPAELPDYWERVAEIVAANPPSETYKTDLVARKVPLYSWKMMSFDAVYLQDVIDFVNGSGPCTAERIARALRERFEGHDADSHANHCFSPTKRLEKVSVWTIKSFHHWLTLRQMLGHNLFTKYDHIVEIGAGMGESARVLHDAYGIPGKYTIVDLPPILQYSQKNLQGYPIEFTSNFKDVEVTNNTLVISTWGLSEIPLDLREEMMYHFRSCDLFVAFQARIFDIDNRDYFCRHYPTMYRKNIQLRQIQLHNVDGGNFYMLAM